MVSSKLGDWQYEEVDPGKDNNAHAYALELVGYNKRVLELVCSSGHMTRALSRQGCRVTCVEVDLWAADLARDAAPRCAVWSPH